MLDLVQDGSSWEEIVDLAVRIEAAGATIINTGECTSAAATEYLMGVGEQELAGTRRVYPRSPPWCRGAPSLGSQPD